MVLGVVRDLRSPRSLESPDDAAAYQEHLLAEYVLARLAHGVADGTIRGEITAVVQFLEHAGVPVWEAEPGHADRFLGQAQRHQAVGTRRGKAKAIDLFFRFLEARYRGEIHELTGRVIASPVDDCNRPRHAGDFQVRVPPSPAALTAFFASWRGELPAARKWLAAARHYAMARLAAETGLRLRELCWLRLEDLHFGHEHQVVIQQRMPERDLPDLAVCRRADQAWHELQWVVSFQPMTDRGTRSCHCLRITRI